MVTLQVLLYFENHTDYYPHQFCSLIFKKEFYIKIGIFGKPTKNGN